MDAQFQSEFCCIAPHSTDRLNVIGFPPALLPSFRAVVEESWPKGILSEGIRECTYEFKLSGSPWIGERHEAVHSRRLVCNLFQFMLRNGWGITLVSNVSEYTQSKDCWYFRKMAPEVRASTCGISFNRRDTIRIIDGPPELTDLVRSVLKEGWSRGLMMDGLYCEVPEFRLWGEPFRTTGSRSLSAGALLMQLVGALEQAGWSVYTSVDVSFEYERRGLDTWILKKR